MIIVKKPKVKNEGLMFQKLCIYYLISFLQWYSVDRYDYHFNFGYSLERLIYIHQVTKIGSDRARIGIQIFWWQSWYSCDLLILMCPLFIIYAHLIYVPSWLFLTLCTQSSRHRPLLIVLENSWESFINMLCLICNSSLPLPLPDT